MWTFPQVAGSKIGQSIPQSRAQALGNRSSGTCSSIALLPAAPFSWEKGAGSGACGCLRTRRLPLVKAFMDYKERSTVWKTDHVLAVCDGITRASGLEYIFTRKCPLPLSDTTKTCTMPQRITAPQPIADQFLLLPGSWRLMV